jgi:hypothetical protein
MRPLFVFVLAFLRPARFLARKYQVNLKGTGVKGTGVTGTVVKGTGLKGTGLKGTGLKGTGLKGTGFSPYIKTPSLAGL